MHESPKWAPPLKTRKQMKSVRALQGWGRGPPYSLQVDQTRLPQMSRTVFIEDASGGAQPPPSLGRFRFREVLAR